jgi:hypothetical protein
MLSLWGVERVFYGFPLLIWTSATPAERLGKISDFRSEISDYRFQIRDFRFQIRDFRSEISDPRFQILDFRFVIRAFGSVLQLEMTDFLSDQRFQNLSSEISDRITD